MTRAVKPKAGKPLIDPQFDQQVKVLEQAILQDPRASVSDDGHAIVRAILYAGAMIATEISSLTYEVGSDYGSELADIADALKRLHRPFG